jgi:hypothetical protein
MDPRHELTLGGLFQRPSCFADSMALRPASLSLPCASSLIAVSRFLADHLLFGVRGVNRSNQKESSNDAACESIQPKQRAVSTASEEDTDWMPEFFLANFINTPSDLSWFSSSHASQA